MKIIENRNLGLGVNAKVHLEYESNSGKILKLVYAESKMTWPPKNANLNLKLKEQKGNFYVLYGNKGTSDLELQVTLLKRGFFTKNGSFKTMAPARSLELASKIFHEEYIREVENLNFK